MNQKTLKKAVYTAFVASALSVGAYGVSFADQAVYAVEDGKQVASKTVYAFKPDSQYEVHCKVGYITDIKLKPGEAVSYSLVGDTSRWMFDQTTVGGVTHIYVKPMAEGIQTNMIINSPTRSYRFIISEGPEDYSAIVEFTFEDEDRKALYSKPVELTPKQKMFNEIYTTNGQIDGRPILKKLNRSYEMKKHGKLADDMLPTEVFDDGVRTYLKMPSSNKYDLPTLYLVDENNKLTLVNYRVRDEYFVADRVFSKARLKYSAKTYVDIVSNDDGKEENKDMQIAERIQNAVNDAYRDIKGEISSTQENLQAEKVKEQSAEIAQLRKQIEEEKEARKKAELAAKKAEETQRIIKQKAEKEAKKHDAKIAKMIAEKKSAEKAAKKTNTAKNIEAEHKETDEKKISETSDKSVEKQKTVDVVTMASMVTKHIVSDDEQNVFNEIFTANGKLDGKKVLQALQTKHETENHGIVNTAILPKTVFTMNGKTYFKIPKEFINNLPQVYVFNGDDLTLVKSVVKGTYLVINGTAPKVRLQYDENVYADITLLSGGKS